MKTRLQSIEQELERADRRGRTIRFLSFTAVVASIIVAWFLLVGLSAVVGILTSTVVATILLLIGCAICALSLCAIALIVWAAPPHRTEVAAAIERAHDQLFDRLNTLAYLERSAPHSPLIAPIAVQTANVLRKKAPGPVFRTQRAWMNWLVFALILVTTVFYYRWTEPWEKLRAAELARNSMPAANRSLVLPPEQPDEQASTVMPPENWGEVQISEPGVDVRAAEFEVIPLRIEAACSQPISSMQLVASLNGDPPTEQALPPPEDPTYVVYQSEIVLPELNAKTWDVIAYFAQATVDSGRKYDSELYFVDVFPLSAELQNIPGGEEGSAYRLLQQLTALMQRQQEIIRAQHQMERLPASENARRELVANQLLMDEQRLVKAAQRVAAAARVQWQHDETLKNLVTKLDETTQALRDAQQALAPEDPMRTMSPQQGTRAALRQLAETRRLLGELTRRSPESFTRSSSLAGSSAPAAGRNVEPENVDPPTAEQLRAAGELVEQIAKKLDQLAERVRSEPGEQLEAEQQEVNQQLFDMPAKHPEATAEVAQPFVDTYESAATAEKRVQGGKSDAPQSAEHASKQAQELADQLKQHELLQELADQIQSLRDVEREPERFDESAMKEQAANTKELIAKLEQFTSQCPQHSDDLKNRLESPGTRQGLNTACQKLGNCKSNGEKSAAASDAAQGLENLSQGLSRDQAQSAVENHHQNLQRELDGMEKNRGGVNAARQDVREMLRTQRDLQKKSSGNNPGALQQLAQPQQQNLERFQKAAEQHRDVLNDIPEPTQYAQDALQRSLEAMQQTAAGHERAEQAGNALQELDSALGEQEGLQNMSDAFRLQELTQRHLRRLQSMEQSPEKYEQEHFQQAAEDSRRLAQQAQQLAQSTEVKENFGNDLANAVDSESMEQIQQASDQLESSASNGEARDALSQLRDLLRSMATAMNASNNSRPNESGDPLREDGYQALARALREIEMLANEQHPLTAQQEQQLRQDAATQFAQGIFGIYGHNERTQQVVDKLEEDVVDLRQPVDQETVQQLMSQVQDLRRESIGTEPESNEPADLSNVDPGSMPPAYRQSIERYFQKLSEEQ